MRHILTTIAILFATQAFAGDAPIRWTGDQTEAFFKGSDHPVSVVRGDTPLHNPINIRCRSSAGCVVMIAGSDLESGTVGTWLCGEVDSTPAMPGCAFEGGDNPFHRIHQQARIAAGVHTLDLIYHSDNTTGTISSWEVEYRIYERPVPPPP
ncbi:MAG TPA: hypothetical protein VMF58_07005 [Rhizomicrobium sp.]|nr:hypothetical protein [Rhizomicrobium sp.]